jgi:A/G-specific adenine glycosylase
MDFGKTLQQWYSVHQRNLPWRQTQEPYAIWLSEVLLQQTRVNQGLSYYHTFLDAYPTIRDLAEAPLDDLLQKWQGLGYYSRCRNLHQTAKLIVQEHQGIFPNSYEGLIKLKGIGPYTAAAIASIAFKEAVPVIDGNVIRVISRFFGIYDSVQQASTLAHIKTIASEYMDAKQPGNYNQALMEFGALHCSPKKPNCEDCMFRLECVAFQDGKVEATPYKPKKVLKVERFLIAFRIDAQDYTLIERRPEKGIWAGLYSFPLFEVSKEEYVSNTGMAKTFSKLGIDSPIIHSKGSIVHVLTHQKLHIQYIHIKTESFQSLENQFQKELITKLKTKGFPIFFKKIGFLNI